MWDLLEVIENSEFATFIRETPSVLGYSTVLALHTFGMAFLVGLSGVIALRVLGIAPELPIAPLKKFLPLIILGFWVNAATGVVLTTLAARSLLSNPDFYIKLAAIVCAIVSLQALRHQVFGASSDSSRPAPLKTKVVAGAMLLFWAIAVTAGRLTAYSGFVRWQTATAVVILTLILLAARYVFTRAWGTTRSAHRTEATTPANY